MQQTLLTYTLLIQKARQRLTLYSNQKVWSSHEVRGITNVCPDSAHQEIVDCKRLGTTNNIKNRCLVQKRYIDSIQCVVRLRVQMSKQMSNVTLGQSCVGQDINTRAVQ